MPSRFEKFSEMARYVLVSSEEEAQTLNHSHIGTEHILLGLIREETSMAAKVLTNLGVSLPKVHSAVRSIIGRGEKPAVGEIGFTSQAKRVIELAIGEASQLGHNYVGTEHILLSLLHEGRGTAAGVLNNFGITLEQVRTEVTNIISKGAVASEGSDFTEGNMASPFEKFSEGARRVLTLSLEEAQNLNHSYIGTEHILLGLIREEDGMAAKVLTNLGISLPEVRSAVESIIGHGEEPNVGKMAFTSQAKRVIEIAIEEARRHNYVGTGHLLLGLLHEGEGVAAGVLDSFGITLERTRTGVNKLAPSKRINIREAVDGASRLFGKDLNP